MVSPRASYHNTFVLPSCSVLNVCAEFMCIHSFILHLYITVVYVGYAYVCISSLYYFRCGFLHSWFFLVAILMVIQHLFIHVLAGKALPLCLKRVCGRVFSLGGPFTIPTLYDCTRAFEGLGGGVKRAMLHRRAKMRYVR